MSYAPADYCMEGVIIISVRKNDRKLSRTEYQAAFHRLYKYSAKQTRKIPKRRRKWLTSGIDNTMNAIYISIAKIQDKYVYTKEERAEFSPEIIELLSSLEMPLYTLWNVQKYETKKMVNWASLINKCIELLCKKCDGDAENREAYVMILDWSKIHCVEFLSNMSSLHRYIHGKVVAGRNTYDDTSGALLIQLVNEAFWLICKANQRIPKTKKEFEQREKHLRTAIRKLYQLDNASLQYFNLMQYSERVMVEWNEMLQCEIRLVLGLMRSDKGRFRDLT